MLFSWVNGMKVTLNWCLTYFMFAEEEASQSVCLFSQNNVKRVKYSFAKVAEFGMVEAAL